MAASPEDLAFARFRRNGAPEALAEVFDRTAGRLLLVALHVTRNGVEAEDLVQATFLQAIQSAERFDPGRSVLPWLLGILAHLASGARRHAAHVARTPGRADVDLQTPVQALLDAEVRDELARALAALPEAYRTVLDLRYVHGLRSVQIARSLGRSPETVRTQVRRGLEHLRRLLPKGLAVPVALLAVRGRGLAAVRSAVLAQARVAPVTVFSGAWLLVVLAALWTAGSALWTATAASAPVPGAAIAVVREPQGTRAPIPPPAASRSIVPEQEPVLGVEAPAAAAPVAASLAPGRVRGRCIADENGEPIAGVRVRLSRRPVFAATADSNGDGRFALEFAAVGATDIVVTLDGPGRARLSCGFRTWSPGQELDLGDVRMPRGVQLRGRIRDRDGHPVSGVSLRAENTSRNGQGLSVGNQAGLSGMGRYGQSDETGGFVCEGRLEPGTWVLTVPGRTLVEPRTVAVGSGEPDRAIDVVVAAQDVARAIRGRCVDENGEPFPGVRLSFRDAGGTRMFALLGTDERGEFVLPYEAGFPDPPDVHFESNHAQPRKGMRAAVAWGTKDLVLTLTRNPKVVESTAEVAIEVVDAADAPIEDFALRCCPDPRQSLHFSTELGALRLHGRHPGGRVVLAASTRWRNVLFVEPADQRLMPAGPVFFAGDQGTVRVVVRPAALLRVRVQAVRTGAPIAGTTVELLRPWSPESIIAITPKVPLRDPFGTLQIAPWSVGMGEATTGIDGIATFIAAAGESGLVVRSLGPKNLPFVQPDIAAGPDLVLVTADPGCSLAGRVLGWDAVRGGLRKPALTLCRRGIGLFSTTLGTAVPDAEDNYSFTGVVGGPWDVHLFFVPEPGIVLAKGVGEPPRRVETPLASIVLDGTAQTLDLDVRALAPGRIEGRLLLDGKPLPYTRLFAASDRMGHQPVDGATTDAEGRFALDPALPGPHWILIQWTPPSGGHRLRILASTPIEIAPGERVQATVELDSSKAEDPFRALRRDR